MNQQLATLFAGAVLAGIGRAQAPYMHRVDSIDPVTAPNGTTMASSISPDGNQVVFIHTSSNLLPTADLAPVSPFEMYRRDLRTNALIQVNLDNQQERMRLTPPTGTLTAGPAVSSDGRFVAFLSLDGLPGDTDARHDVFVRDTLLGTTDLVSGQDLAPTGLPINGQPRISGDGRFVVYPTQVKLVFHGGPIQFDAIALHDRQTNTTVPVHIVDLVFSPYVGNEPVISTDGSTVAFYANTPGSGIFVDNFQLHTYDVATGQVTVYPQAGTTFSSNHGLAIDGTGQKVAFTSGLALLPEDTDSAADIYVLDVATGGLQLGTGCYSGQENAGYVSAPSLSGNGRYLAYQSNDACYAGTGSDFHVFVTDLQTGLVTLQSINDLGEVGTVVVNSKRANVHGPQSLSATGERVTFTSTFANLAGPQLTPDVFNVTTGVYMRERQVEGAELDITNLVAAQTATLQITGAGSNSLVLMGYSFAGQGPTPTYWGLIDLAPPISVFPLAADGAGTVTTSLPVPAALAGMRVWMKGLDLGLSKPTTTFMGVIQ